MTTSDEEFLEKLRQTLDVPVEANPSWFLKAFTHRSYANERDLEYDNERLEFLGDTVLDLCVAEYLFREYPEDREGRLSKIKSAVVRADALSRMARELDLPEFIRLSKGEAQVKRGRDKVVADTFEAFVGALYMSSGLEAVREYILPFVRQETQRYLKEGGRNYKGQLLEFTQERNLPNPVYEVDKVKGPEHDPVHCVKVKVRDTVYGSGEGSTKKAAEQAAAEEALTTIRTDLEDED
jgi:ribonuclease-3